MTVGLIVHVPHASVDIPAAYRADFLLPDNELEYQAKWSADLYCDELFDIKESRRIFARQNRLVCDVERFRDDRLESCAALGNGLYYINTLLGVSLRPDDPVIRNKILSEVYDPHHKRLTAAVDEALENNDACLIIDGHSFMEDMAIYDRQFKEMKLSWRVVNGVRKADGLPDFCIGTDSFHTPDFLRDGAHEFLRGLGYSTETDRPFAGAIVPMKHYQKDRRVFSLMIEVNRRLYLQNGTFEKSDGFAMVKNVCGKLVDELARLVGQR